MTLASPLDSTGATDFSIPELVKYAESGTIRIPTFQRSFVWDGSDVRKLFDSLYRGFPVGTLLLWQQPAEQETIFFGPIRVNAPQTTHALWVVDGQQRVTSLFACLSLLAAGVDERFEVYFDLETKRFVNAKNGVISPRAIPLREAQSSRSAAAWTRKSADDLEPDDFDAADALVGVIRDYRIPAYVVSGDNQALLREVFDRVNSAGRPITRAQTFHALFANDTQPGSPASVSRALSSTGFGEIDDGRIVQSLLAIRGGNVQRDIHDEFVSGDDPAEWYDKVEAALGRAIEFLQKQGIPHLLLMPNTLPLPVLAAFFHLHPEPSPWIERLLSRWLWRGWVREFGREGGQTPTMRRAITSVNPRKLAPNEAPDEYLAVKRLLDYVPDVAPPELPISPLRTDKSWSRLLLLSLVDLRPKNLNGTEMNVAAELNQFGAGAIREIVPNHRSRAASRAFWPANSVRPTGNELQDILDSHAISESAANALKIGDRAEFIEVRERDLTILLQEFLNSKLEVGASNRPPIADLLVLDMEDSADGP
ncbi:DUF262 domain-containing protein [Pseudonocardia sp. NPDC046786]|uniref:DUF262 domain-containing protein n=1 Tax=Pseudonocardia sp. NPDC046786 TaxID=3155471 RepID=UPI003407F477